MKLRFSCLALLSLVVSLPFAAHADDARFRPNDVRTLFRVAKNTNRNVVEYGLRLDKDCVPVGNAPVYAYWRDHESGPNVTSDLSFLDETVYGIARQSVTKRTLEESRIVLALKAANDRSIGVTVKKIDGKCVAESYGAIRGAPARLDEIFVHVAGFMSVDWVEIRGAANGKPVIERVKR